MHRCDGKCRCDGLILFQRVCESGGSLLCSREHNETLRGDGASCGGAALLFQAPPRKPV